MLDRGREERAFRRVTTEALCKVLAHNLVVLIHETYELGIELAFWNQGHAGA